MSIEIVWEDEAQTIMRHVYGAQWTSDEYESMNHQSHDLIVAQDHPVYLITDMLAGAPLPPNAFGKREKIERLVPPNLPLNVIVTSSLTTRALLKTMVSLGQVLNTRGQPMSRFEFAGTLEEARTIIARHREAQAAL